MVTVALMVELICKVQVFPEVVDRVEIILLVLVGTLECVVSHWLVSLRAELINLLKGGETLFQFIDLYMSDVLSRI